MPEAAPVWPANPKLRACQAMLQARSEKPKPNPGCSALQGDDESKSQKRGGLGGLFGGRSKASADAPTGPQKQKKTDSKLVDAKPAGKEVCCSSLLQLTTVSVSVRPSTAV